MRIFLTTCALLAMALAGHVVLWKVRLPKQQSQALLWVFGAIFALWLASTGGHLPPLVDLLYVASFYASASLGYIVLYSAIQVDSPTLSLMRFLAEAGAAGRSPEEVSEFLGRRPFVQARLAALKQSGLISEEAGQYIICGKQSLGYRFILNYRKLYGSIPKGG